jgi:hypothetical protein
MGRLFKMRKFKEGDVVKYIYSDEYLLITHLDNSPQLSIYPLYYYLVLTSDKRTTAHKDGHYEADWMEDFYEVAA